MDDEKLLKSFRATIKITKRRIQGNDYKMISIFGSCMRTLLLFLCNLFAGCYSVYVSQHLRIKWIEILCTTSIL